MFAARLQAPTWMAVRPAAGLATEFAVEGERFTGLVRRARDPRARRADVGLAEVRLLPAGNAGVIAAARPVQAAAASGRYVEPMVRFFEASPR